MAREQIAAFGCLQREMHVMNRLNGKTAVITGGATGIGRAAAKRFIEEGAFVFIFGRRQEALDAAIAELGPDARAVKGSVSDPGDLDRLYAAVKAERGTLDIVFANAGVGKSAFTRQDHCRAHRRNLRHQCEGHDLHGPAGVAADGPGRFDHPDRIERRNHGRPGVHRLQREQGGGAQPRAHMGGGPEGQPASVSMFYRPARPRPNSRRKPWAKRARRPTGAMTPLQRMADPAEIAAGCCLSRVVGQQLHDGQRGRRRRGPGSTLTQRSRAGAAANSMRARLGWSLADLTSQRTQEDTMTKKTYQGSCHCGAVAFEAKIDFDKGTTRCNCSLCTKSRFWFAIVAPEEFEVERGDDQLTDYAWIPPGKSESHLRYRFCRTCGVRTFAEGNDAKFYAVSIAALDGIEQDADQLAQDLEIQRRPSRRPEARAGRHPPPVNSARRRSS